MGEMDLGMVFDARPGDPNILDEAARKKVAEFINNRVGDLVCPDHHKAPTIICQGKSLDSLSFDVTGCCTKIIQITKEKLSE